MRDRIPYDEWINSQLSIARHYGSIVLNGETYVLDYDSCTPAIENGEELYKPDLVKIKKLKINHDQEKDKKQARPAKIKTKTNYAETSKKIYR